MNDVLWMDPMIVGAGYEYTKAELEAIRLACPVTCSVCKPGHGERDSACNCN